MDLNEIMQFDRVIRVHSDGSVDADVDWKYAPDLNAHSDDEGQHTADTDPDLERQAKAQGWRLESGWTGQYGYSGVCMHPSEFVGGALARHILDTPGFWVATVISEDDGEAEMWAIAYRED